MYFLLVDAILSLNFVKPTIITSRTRTGGVIMAITNSRSEKTREDGEKGEKRPYKQPAIIFEGIITTHAGSPTPLTGDGDDNAVDPADLFGNGS